MKKVLLALPLIIFTLFVFTNEESKVLQLSSVKKMNKVVDKKPFDRRLVDLTRIPTIEQKTYLAPKPIRLVKSRQIKRTPASEIRIYKTLPNGLALIENHFAIKKDDYRPSMGDIFLEREGMVFIQSERRPDSGASVAYDEKNKGYYPVSAVLKIKEVDENLRQNLIADGYEEHYYHAPLKVMYVQSGHDGIIQLYEEAQKKDLKAELEIIRAYNRPR